MSEINIPDNETSSFNSVQSDILQNSLVEQEPEAERLRLLESVVLYANDVILITEAEPVDLPGPLVVYVNPAFTQMTGYEACEIIGQTPRMLQGENTNPQTLAYIRQQLSAWEPFTVELLNYRKDGSSFWVEISAHTVNNNAGFCTHWIAIQRDISERKRAEAERAAQEARDRAFVKEVLRSVTGKKLELCDSEEELPHRLPECITICLDTAADLAPLRTAVCRIAG
ncbi:MAG: PAS domain S-box protein, partial [Armatimonadetes bacterium]|nr:PAS domain S-box protein [Armatimonadota bacterium]